MTVESGRVLNRFRPDQALGAGVDGHERGDTRQIYTPANLRAMRSAGLRPLSYRLRTELGVEAWHWNPVGRWSDPTHRQGYFTGSSVLRRGLVATYGYRLPRRGDTVDQANDDGYSRLDDGRIDTFWKSDPYLDPHYTREPATARPQWLLIDLGKAMPVDTIRIAWAAPYARRVQAQWYTGRDAVIYSDDRRGYWLPFSAPAFAGTGGTQTLRVEPRRPRLVRYLRVLLFDSSHTSPSASPDARDRLGFAVREIYAGRLVRTRARIGFTEHLVDLVRHRASNRQTVTYVSSTDPWHRAADLDLRVEQPSFETVLRSGLTNRRPMLVPIPTLYGTPEDAIAQLRYIRALHTRVAGAELGEEPDGQLVTPEDYGALYEQFARRIHRNFPRLRLGGPGYQTSIPDWVSWPLQPGGDISWTRRFLRQLAGRGAMRELSFFSFEWYPFDNGCAPAGPQLQRAPALLSDVIAAQYREGLPRTVPLVMTEYGYSAFATSHMVDIAGALLNADIVGRFLAEGGRVAYLYGYEPGALIQELDCRTWGNLILLRSDDSHRIVQPVATYWGARMLSQEWAQTGDGVHAVLGVARGGVPLNGRREPVVSAYAVRRPDRRTAVLLVNKDPVRAISVAVRVSPRRRSAAGPVDVIQFSSTQYRWHPRGAHGFASPAEPPMRSRLRAGAPVRLPPFSMTVVRMAP